MTITDISWEKISASKDGIAEYQARSRYEGHKMTHVFFATDELAADRKVMRAYIRKASIDFVEENPPA